MFVCLFSGAICSVVVETDGEDDGVIHVYNKENWKGFTMGKVFGSKSTQEEVIVMCTRENVFI